MIISYGGGRARVCSEGCSSMVGKKPAIQVTTLTPKLVCEKCVYDMIVPGVCRGATQDNDLRLLRSLPKKHLTNDVQDTKLSQTHHIEERDDPPFQPTRIQKHIPEHLLE